MQTLNKIITNISEKTPKISETIINDDKTFKNVLTVANFLSTTITKDIDVKFESSIENIENDEIIVEFKNPKDNKLSVYDGSEHCLFDDSPVVISCQHIDKRRTKVSIRR